MEHYIYLQIAAAQEFFLGGAFLFLRSRGNRARRLLGCLFLLNSLNIALRTVLAPPETFAGLKQTFFSPTIVLLGASIIIQMTLYIIEVIRPGWMGWKRAFYLILPWIGSGLFYFLTLRILGEPARKLTGWADLWQHIGEFNVWFRFVLLAVTTSYIGVIHWVVIRYRSYYEEWCARNFAEPEAMNLAWMQRFAWGLVIVTLLYFGVLFRVWDPIFEIHQVCFMLTIGYLIYKALFHKNPYPERFFAATMNEAAAEAEASEADMAAKVSEEQFLRMLPGYVQQVETWMETAKPYLRSDFQLIDTGEVLKLNRTYFSRIFNEGMGGSFSQVVQRYRVERAKEMLREEPETGIETIASKCGFATLSSFYRTFQKHTGMTPGEYRKL